MPKRSLARGHRTMIRLRLTLLTVSTALTMALVVGGIPASWTFGYGSRVYGARLLGAVVLAIGFLLGATIGGLLPFAVSWSCKRNISRMLVTIVAALAVCAVVIQLLFPPWVAWSQGEGVQISLGHRSVFAPPTQYHAYGVDIRVLVMQLAASVGITGLIIDVMGLTGRLLEGDREHRTRT